MDADNFEDATEFQEFARDQGYGEIAGLAHRLWDLGFRSCAFISCVKSALGDNIFATLLNAPPEVPKARYVYALNRLGNFASVHSNMSDLETVLSITLPEPQVHSMAPSASQTDTEFGDHPSIVQEWDDFYQFVHHHKTGRRSTSRRFLHNVVYDQRFTNEQAVSEVFGTQVSCTVNAGIRHWKRQKWLQHEGKVFAQWQSQGDTLTDIEVAANLQSAGQSETDDAASEEASIARTQAVASSQLFPGRSFDKHLTEADTGIGRSMAKFARVYEPVTFECLMADGWRGRPYYDQIPPDLVKIWNHPQGHKESLSNNVIRVIEQWNRYASENGTRYGVIFTHLWTWVLVADGSNKLRISPAIRYDHPFSPTVLEVVDFITHEALKESGMCPRWETLRVHPQLTAASDPSEGSAEVLGTSGHAVSLSNDAIRFAQVAAALERDWIKGVLGRGALGAVYEARMPCGRLVALKLAPPGSREENFLRNEADVYMVLQELWNKDVPELLLAGPLRAFRSAYALGTCLLPGRRLEKGDEDLLPAALAILAKIHAKGVIHGDLSPGNCLVNDAGVARGGTKTIVLIDFSHASLNSDKEDQDDENAEMIDLFKCL